MSNAAKSKGLIDELNDLKAKLFDRDKRINALENRLMDTEWKLDQTRRENENLEKQIVRQEHTVALHNALTKIWTLIHVLCVNLKLVVIDLKLLIVAGILLIVSLGVASYTGNGTFGIFWNAISQQTISTFLLGMFLLEFLAIYKWVVNNSRWQPQPSSWIWTKWITVGVVVLLAAVTIIAVVALLRLDAIIALLRWLRESSLS